MVDKGEHSHRKLPWHQSLIGQLAIWSGTVLLIAYSISVFISYQGVKSLTPLVYDQSIEYHLSLAMQQAKGIHQFKQRIAIEKMRPLIRAWQRNQYETPSKVTVLGWSNSLDDDLLPESDLKDIEEIEEPFVDDSGPLLEWIERDRLRVLNYIINFKSIPEIESFDRTADLKVRYQLIGSELSSKIIPSLSWAYLISISISFLLFGIAFVYIGRRFERHLVTLLDGFAIWGGGRRRFRFYSKLPGELGIVARQFNKMASSLAEEQEKTLRLEKIASWQGMARRLSHEIKNPLTPIKMMMAQLVRKYPGDDTKFAQLLGESNDIIQGEIRSLTRLIDHFARFAELPTPEIHHVDIVPVIRKVGDLLSRSFTQHKFTYLGEPSHTLAVDEDLIKEVLLNLCKNAYEASESPIHLVIELMIQARHARISISDNGPGIPVEQQKKIFEPYFSRKPGVRKGAGLGLTICQKIILDHGGSISMRSQPGQTMFVIELPRNLIS